MDDKVPAPLRQPLPALTRRDTWIPMIPGKILTVIGMRRSGKTSLQWQEVGQRVRIGAERAWLPTLTLEDELLLAQAPGVELSRGAVCPSMRSSASPAGRLSCAA